MDNKSWTTGRDYSLFGLLAGVRSQRFDSLIEPRGLPDDCSKKITQSFNDDGHTASWYSLKELLEFRSNNKANMTAALSMKEYKEFKINQPLDREVDFYYFQAPTLASIISIEEMERRLGLAAFINDEALYYVNVEWETSIANINTHFWNKIVDRMAELDANPENVRYVFFFDN